MKKQYEKPTFDVENVVTDDILALSSMTGNFGEQEGNDTIFPW